MQRFFQSKMSWAVLGIFLGACSTEKQSESVYFATAKQAAEWLDASKQDHTNGLAWPIIPGNDAKVSMDLYSGSAGPVLFYLDLYLATQDSNYLYTAGAGASTLIAALDDPPGSGWAGLYTGVAGIGFVLTELYRVTGDSIYAHAARKAVSRLQMHARYIGSGVEWQPVTDIISGTAGTGLFLLYAHEAFGDQQMLNLAKKAGVRLIAYAMPAAGGLKWPMAPSFPRLMPNFSHGTAGVAYFLARLYEETGEELFLKMALQGGEYLLNSADSASNAGLIFHHEPEGEQLFYLGWCHGPPGTSRLFWKLHLLQGDQRWLTQIEAAATALMASGIPQKQTPGFWNNVSQCCGSAGVVRFFLDLYRRTRQDKYLRFARKIADDLVERGTRTSTGMKWVQAEHRMQPDELFAQTGFMQGAAGIGMALLELYRVEQGLMNPMRFPDEPL